MNPIDRLLDQFVADVTRTAQTLAMDALRGALAKPIGAASPAVAQAPAGRAVRQPRRRRFVATAALADQIVMALRAKPGQTVGDLGARLDQPTSALQPAIKTLVVSRQLRFRGQTRARKYFPVAARRKAKSARPRERTGRKKR